jgi:predicted Zn-dependent protease
MFSDKQKLNLIRVGAHMTYSSMRQIGDGILQAFEGIIFEINLAHHNAPSMGSIDAQLLTMILDEEYHGHILGITDADLRTCDDDEFYNSILGGKNPKNDVAVVSTRKLTPVQIETQIAYERFIARVLKVSLHEIGHNLGLTDHAAYRTASDGSLCPMSRGEFNRFGYRGYVRVVVDGRGLRFCEECAHFLKTVYPRAAFSGKLVKDGLTVSHN